MSFPSFTDTYKALFYSLSQYAPSTTITWNNIWSSVLPFEQLLNRIPYSFQVILPWFLRWPTICTILHELDYLCHEKKKTLPSLPPRLGQNSSIGFPLSVASVPYTYFRFFPSIFSLDPISILASTHFLIWPVQKRWKINHHAPICGLILFVNKVNG